MDILTLFVVVPILTAIALMFTKDLKQARNFLKALNLELFLEPIEIEAADLDWKKTIKIVEDYKLYQYGRL